MKVLTACGANVFITDVLLQVGSIDDLALGVGATLLRREGQGVAEGSRAAGVEATRAAAECDGI